MTVTTIDETPALVVIDLQKGIVARPSAHPIEDIVANSARLAAAFRAHGLPVVLVNAAGVPAGRTEGPARSREFPPDFAELVPELDEQPSDHLVTKMAWGAFTGTSLHETLQKHGVTQVVVTGVATQFGVESTARSAHEHGYHVVLATDAITSFDETAHNHTLRNIFPALGQSGTTDELLELLNQSR